MVSEKKLLNESGLNEKIKPFTAKEDIKALAAKADFKAEKDEIVKLRAFDSIYFHGKSHFENDGTHNYLVFLAIFKNIVNRDHISVWKPKALLNECIKPWKTIRFL